MKPLDPAVLQQKFERVKSQITSFEGADAIFEEAGKVTHVQVRHIAVTPEHVATVMTDLQTTGMEKLSHSPCEISVCWELLDIDGERWSALLPIRWQLTFDAEAVQILKEIAAILAPRGAVISSTIVHEVRRIRFEMRFPRIRSLRR
jgi:hypothetical protein